MIRRDPSLQLGMCVTSVYDDDGFVGIQCDVFGEAESGMPPFDAVHPYGFEGRPLDRDAALAGAEALYWFDGPEGHVMPLGDSRGAGYLPQLSKGSSRQYSALGQFMLLDYDAETATLYTPFDSQTKAHVLTMGKDGNGKPYVGIVQSEGLALLMLEDSLVIKNAAGDAYIELNSTGIVLNGNVKLVGGLDVGGGTALPLLIGTLFQAWWSALSATLTASGPSTPLTGSALGALFSAAAAGLTATQTTLTKGL
jgi:hypothetical protein